MTQQLEPEKIAEALEEWAEQEPDVTGYGKKLLSQAAEALRHSQPSPPDDVVEALRKFVDHYPMGINPSLDDAYRKAKAALAAGVAGGWRVEGRLVHLQPRPAWWTYDAEVPAYYFAPTHAAKPPYLEQRHVTAILDIASDGTLAGVELMTGDLPSPPAVKG